MSKRVNLTDEQRAAMSADYENGKGMGTIAKEFECSIPTVRRNLVAQGTEIRKKGRPRKDRTASPAKLAVVEGPAAEAVVDEVVEGASSEFAFPTEL